MRSSKLRGHAGSSIVAMVSLLLAMLPEGVPAQDTRRPDPWEASTEGFVGAELDRAWHVADSLGVAAVVALHGDDLVAAWGAWDRPLELHSVRKAVTHALIGTAVARGELDPSISLAESGFRPSPPLTIAEGSATIDQLMASRSGIYLPAAYEGSPADRPDRGAHPPGTFWWYNNWDFNALETLLEGATGTSIFQLVSERLAVPLGFQDWRETDGFEVFEPRRSSIPAHTLRMSARDLARVGRLYRDGGNAGGGQLLPEAWVRGAGELVTDFGDHRGYGRMWWVWEAGSLTAEQFPSLSNERFTQAVGTGGHHMLVIPGADMVVVVRTDTDIGRRITTTDAFTIVDALVGARAPVSAPHSTARPQNEVFRELSGAPGTREDPLREPATVVDAAGYLGQYDFGPMGSGELHAWSGRVFVVPPRGPESQLLRASDGEFGVRFPLGVRIRLSRAPDQSKVLTISMGGRTMEGRMIGEGLPLREEARTVLRSAVTARDVEPLRRIRAGGSGPRSALERGRLPG